MPFNKIIFSNAVDQGGSRIDDQIILRGVSRVDQQVPSTPDGLIPQFEVIKEQNKILYNNGEIEFEETAIYSVFVSLNLSVGAGFTNSIEFWSEFFDGNTWTPIEDSGKLNDYSVLSEGSFVLKVNATVPAGAKIRFKVRTTGGSLPVLSAPTLTNGVQVPSTQLSISLA